MRQLSGTDWSMLAADTPHAQNLIAPLQIYDPSTAPGGQVTYDDVLDRVRSRLHISESFRERLVTVPFGLDRPYWINDVDFDLEYHVRHIALPEPGDWEQLCTQVARIGARPLDLSRPPWELYLIEGLNSIDRVPPGSFGILMKLHHAAVDGVAGTEIVTALLDLEPDAAPEPADDPWQAETAPSTGDLIRRALLNGARQPAGAVRTLFPAVRSIGDTIRRSREAAAPRPATMLTATRFNRSVGPHRVWGSTQIDLADLKKIRTAVPDAKINDVALAIVGGAMRAYLDDKDELPGEPLVAMMPISIRPTQTQLAKAGGAQVIDAGGGGNSFAMAPVSMATDLTDPRERLRRIQQATQAVKDQGASSAASLMEMSQLLPGSLIGTVQRAVIRASNRAGRALGVHTTVTNVPGPQVPMYFCGARAVIMTGMAPVVDGMGLINGVGSYNGIVPICFTADRDMMPDPRFYEQCLQNAVDELLEAASSSRPTARTKAATRKAGTRKAGTRKAGTRKAGTAKRAASSAG